MERQLRVVVEESGHDLEELRSALAGGDAILPVSGHSVSGGPSGSVPSTVDERVAVVVQTSGSTGTSKRVGLSAEALLASAAASDIALGGPGQWLLALPIVYIAGINVLVRSLRAGTIPVTLAPGHFDALDFVRAARQLDHERLFTSLVPAQLSTLIAEENAHDDLRRFTRILVGGQATPQGLVDSARGLGLNVTRTYGSTETCGGCVYDGVPLPTAMVRVVDGEVELGGPMLAEGYLDDDVKTAHAFHTDLAGRWYRTSDAGEWVEGILRVTGRLDDVIVSGGIKVSLAAVERVVRALPGQENAVVVGRQDERWGEVPVLFTTRMIPVEGVRAAVEAELGAAARPSEVVVVESIPLLVGGKPDRVALSRR